MFQRLKELFSRQSPAPRPDKDKLHQSAVLGRPLFCRSTQNQLETDLGSEGAQAYQEVVRQAILSRKPAFRQLDQN